MVAVLSPARKPPPQLPDHPEKPPERVIVEKHIIERVAGEKGKDGRDGKDGRNARPSVILEYDVVYRRDVVSGGYDLESFSPRDERSKIFVAGADRNGRVPVVAATGLLRLSLGHDIVSEAVVGSRVRIAQEGENIFSFLPVRFSPALRTPVPTIRLVMAIEVYDG